MGKKRESLHDFDKVPADVSAAAAKTLLNSVKVYLRAEKGSGLVTHHKWIWNLRNTSDEPMEYIYYFLEGDVPRSFSELNVKVIDSAGNPQSIMQPRTDKPLRKEFYVSLSSPISPYEKNRKLVLEYDWEQPERKYVYNFQPFCKAFSFELEIPKELSITPRIYFVDVEYATKYALSALPIRKPYGKWLKLIWSLVDIHPRSNVGFEW
jgi:hypothetical protein